MDYDSFFAEMANWTKAVNQMALTHTMESTEFWQWVTKSIGDIADYYGNTPLVQKQLTMMYLWLEEAYAASKKKTSGGTHE